MLADRSGVDRATIGRLEAGALARPTMPRRLRRVSWPPCRLAIVGALLALTFGSAGPASAQLAPFCPPGQFPQFQFGFAALKQQLGSGMGQPMGCEHADPFSGDSLQRTTTGLAFYRQRTNTPTFTDGNSHWAVVSGGLAFWRGVSIEPPAEAVVLTPDICDALPGTATGLLAAGCLVLFTYRYQDANPLP